MTINFSELSTQEIHRIIAEGQRLLDERTDSAITEKTQAIATLIDEIYELVSDEGGDPDVDVFKSYDTTLLDVRNSFTNLSWRDFQRED